MVRYKHCNKCKKTYKYLYFRERQKWERSNLLYCPNCNRIRFLDEWNEVIKEVRLNERKQQKKVWKNKMEIEDIFHLGR